MHEENSLEKYFILARGLYQTGPSHDFSHIERVYKLALRIGKAELADLKILGLAALFHDISRETETSSGGEICHARASAERAGEILEKSGEDPLTVKAVCQCIATHRFRDNNPPQSIEDKCLFDADKLDSLGAVGVARAYLWLGEHGGKLFVEREIWEKTDFNCNKPENDSLQREWHIKLKDIKDKLYTETARKIALKRAKTMENFLRDLELEIQGED